MLSFPAESFTQATSGFILGRVTDQQDSAIPDARVTAKNEGTGLVQSTQTGPEGEFTLANLPVGAYTLTVTKPGSKVISRSGLRLQVDQKMRVDIELALGELSEVVNVKRTLDRYFDTLVFNVTGLDTTTPGDAGRSLDLSSGEFGTSTGTVGNPRIIQFAAKLRF